MYLRTFGALALEDAELTRPKPLLLLAYLAVEGPLSRRQVAELFWPDGRDHMKSLTVALSRIRKGAPGAVAADDDRAWATVSSDVKQFLERLEAGGRAEALEIYCAPFLEGFYLRAWSAELEGWVYRTREHLAAHARGALLDLAEAQAARSCFAVAVEHAERALSLAEAAPEPDSLARLHTVLLAGHSAYTEQARLQAEEFGISLCAHAEEARQRLAGEPNATRTSTPHNVPAVGTPFIGRDLELEELATLLRRGGRLVTIKGAAGVGKSRLALEAARQRLARGGFEDGVFVVMLESLASPGLVPNLIADAIGLELEGAGEPLRQVIDHIGDRKILLVLDSFEHLTPGAVAVSNLVRACACLRVLVSSREQLNVAEEQIFPLAGLPYPDHGDLGAKEAARFDAVSLYVQRARRANPEFELSDSTLPGVLETCRLVEGLPLGIELAAAWLGVLPPDEIAAEITRNLDFLIARTRNAPRRHRSLRRAFEHSWELLSAGEQEVLRKLAVFRGGFARDAAGEIAGATVPVLASLVEKSLLRVDRRWRYDRHPLLYQYTLEKLAERPEELAQARERHGERFFAFLRRLEDQLVGSTQTEALDAIERELDNVRVAWRWASEERRLTELQQGCRPLQLFYIQRGGMAEEGAREFAYAADQLDESDARHDASHDASHDAGYGASHDGSRDASQRANQRAVAGRLRIAEAWFRFRLGDADRSTWAAERGLRLLNECLDLPSGAAATADADGSAALHRAVISAHNTLGHLGKRRGDYASAQDHFQKAMDLARQHGNEPQVAITSNNLALVLKALGRYRDAERLYRQAIALNRTLGNHRSVVRNLANLGGVLVLDGDPSRAGQVLQEGLDLADEIEYHDVVPELLVNLAGAAFAAADYDRARELCRDARERKAHDGRFDARVSELLGRTATAQGDYEAARRAFCEALETARPTDEWTVVDTLIGVAELMAAQGDAPRAARVLHLVRDDSCHRYRARQQKRELTQALGVSLPIDELHRAQARGNAESLEEAVAEALRHVSAP